MYLLPVAVLQLQSALLVGAACVTVDPVVVGRLKEMVVEGGSGCCWWSVVAVQERI
jgi:hypothetical protein